MVLLVEVLLVEVGRVAAVPGREVVVPGRVGAVPGREVVVPGRVGAVLALVPVAEVRVLFLVVDHVEVHVQGGHVHVPLAEEVRDLEIEKKKVRYTLRVGDK